MRYSSEPDGAIIAVPLDTLTALYHRRSGQTHLVAAPVPDILAALSTEGRDLEAILAALDIEDSADARAALKARLDELSAAGLVSAQ